MRAAIAGVVWLTLAPWVRQAPPVAAPAPQAASQAPAAAAKPAEVACDADGAITCVQEVETVSVNRSALDMRVIGKFIQLISERNRRYYAAWSQKAPSASFEVVKRIKEFPYLPGGDNYGIQSLEVVLSQSANLVTVRYPKKPDDPRSTEKVSYSGKLDAFIKTLERENDKLKKYDVKKF